MKQGTGMCLSHSCFSLIFGVFQSLYFGLFVILRPCVLVFSCSRITKNCRSSIPISKRMHERTQMCSLYRGMQFWENWTVRNPRSHCGQTTYRSL